jgi:hydroxyethylthiazole kinase-like sugar kinase family protein
MSTAQEEMEDLGAVIGSVLVNIGTLKSENREAMRRAGVYPIVLVACNIALRC